MSEEEGEVTIFYVHKDTGEKLWDDSPPAGEEHLYETWEFDAATGEVSQQVAAVEDPPGSRSASSDDEGVEWRSASDEDEVVPLPSASVPPAVEGGGG